MTRSGATRWLIIAALGGAAVSFLWLAAASGQTTDATITIGSAQTGTNTQVTVDLTVEPAPGVTVGAIDLTVFYDDALISATGCSATPGSGGICNAFSTPNTLTFSYANLSGLNGDLGDLSFMTLSAEAAAFLVVNLTACADTTGTSLECAAQDGSIIITLATPSPTPSPTPTPAPTASPTPSQSPFPTSTPSIDFDNDGVPNALDNCPYTANGPAEAGILGVGNQTDSDGDGIPGVHPQYYQPFGGDACDFDDDNDEFSDGFEPGCRTRPEDFDGYQDNDGCPDADNDGDGVCDAGLAALICSGEDFGRTAFYATGHNHTSPLVDCRNTPEDLDGFQDADGCPEPDNDNDGFSDPDDACDGNDNLTGPDGMLGSGEDQDHDGLLDPGEDTIGADGVLTSDDSTRTYEDYDGASDTDGCHDFASGDVDCQGTVNSIDALKVLRYAAGLAVPVPQGCVFSGDVNCSEDTNAIDALLILRFAASLAATVPEGCPPVGG